MSVPHSNSIQMVENPTAVDERTRRIKMILPESVEVRHLYEIADAHTIQIRRLEAKRDSLQDIFMKAMETGAPR